VGAAKLEVYAGDDFTFAPAVHAKI